MKFQISSATEDFIKSTYHKLGARNQAILARAGLFLALGRGVPTGFRPKDLKGVTLSDETVVGDDFAGTVRAAIQFHAGRPLDDDEYTAEFRRYLEYGCGLLKDIWTESHSDPVEFMRALLGGLVAAQDSERGLQPPVTYAGGEPLVSAEVELHILEDHEPWSLNGVSASNALLIISGQPGSGKSQLALDLLSQLTSFGVPFLFFDMKGELGDESADRKPFLEDTGARYVRLVDDTLPINPLLASTSGPERARDASAVAEIIRAFAPQFGPLQERAVIGAYKDIGVVDFYALQDHLSAEGKTGVGLSVISRICDFQIFARSESAIPPSEWLSRSLVVDFKKMTDGTTKALTVGLILNYLMATLSIKRDIVNGVQPLRLVVFVDEAHLLLPKEAKVELLGKLARQGRAWGMPLWLASQDADGFISVGDNRTDFAELAHCAVHFSPETVEQPSKRARLFGEPKVWKLEKGEALVRFASGPPKIGLARQYYKTCAS